MGLNETEGSTLFSSVFIILFTRYAANADTSKNPRGIRGFKLDVGDFTTWKVQGKIGGYMK